VNISGDTRVFGLIGQPVAHSLSPRLMNDAFTRLGLDAVYVAWPVAPDRVGAVLAGLAALGTAGINVTYPHKQAVLPHLVARSATVDVVGAANVLTLADGGRFRGDNTDAPGVPLALRELAGVDPEGRRVVILGAGGAARAAAHGLLGSGAATVTCAVRDPGRARASLAGLRAVPDAGRLTVARLGDDDAADALRRADLVVQATPVGLDDPDAAPLVTPGQAPHAAGFELNYGRLPSAFAAAWRAAGRICPDGRDLLAAQAHLALRIWLGDAPDLAAMRAVIAEEETS
jgi:shikimate dehydrogenase